MKKLFIILFPLLFAACNKEESSPVAPPVAKDPNTALRVSIDRFSSSAGNLFVRTSTNGLPNPNVPINFDSGPFITRGFGPTGQSVAYYNFDVQPTTSAPIFVFFREGESTPVTGQLNVIDVIPGDQGYNDFWRVTKVIVPSNYVVNSVTSRQGIISAGYRTETTTMLVNCPVVPEGSTANLRLGGGSNGLVRGWHKDQIVFYFTFEERALTTDAAGNVPLSPIYVTFNINPDLPNGGPPSGFKQELSSVQTHNVVATIPSSTSYSPLWIVNVYDNADFNSVSNLTTAQAARILGAGVANVNCPVVSVQ